jgi:DNA processing protein
VQIHCFTQTHSLYPQQLLTIAQPPRQIYVIGNTQILSHESLAVVGSRAVTPYGKQVTLQLTTEIAWASIPIVSGLALGVDGLAHQAALEAKGATIAVLPGGIKRVYPSNHKNLADQILKRGGALVSEYGGHMRPQPYHFIARNRLIAGISKATLITEAAEKSGSLHTAQFALEQGKEVMAVPGSIFSGNSVGTHNLIKDGAQLVSGAETILNYFSKSSTSAPAKGDNEQEQLILDLINGGVLRTDELIEQGEFEVPVFNHHMTMLEVSGKVQRARGGRWSVR